MLMLRLIAGGGGVGGRGRGGGRDSSGRDAVVLLLCCVVLLLCRTVVLLAWIVVLASWSRLRGAEGEAVSKEEGEKGCGADRL